MNIRNTIAAAGLAALAGLVTPAVAGPADGVHAIHHVQPFTLAQAIPYAYSAERLPITSGQIVVLEVDPDLARPRQVQQPILFAGDIPVQIMGIDADTGCIAGIVPKALDLRTNPIYFGLADIAERVDQAIGQAELSKANAAGFTPFSVAELTAVRAELMAFDDPEDLYDHGKSFLGLCQ